MSRGIMIDASDNVGIVLEAVGPGDPVSFKDRSVTALEEIPVNHKIALADLEPGDRVVKYGYPIGYATQPIRKGQWVHIHNLDAQQMMK